LTSFGRGLSRVIRRLGPWTLSIGSRNIVVSNSKTPKPTFIVMNLSPSGLNRSKNPTSTRRRVQRTLLWFAHFSNTFFPAMSGLSERKGVGFDTRNVFVYCS
jgi:hypothetical protein